MDSVGEGEGGKIWRMALKHVKYHVWNEKKKKERKSFMLLSLGKIKSTYSVILNSQDFMSHLSTTQSIQVLRI